MHAHFTDPAADNRAGYESLHNTILLETRNGPGETQLSLEDIDYYFFDHNDHVLLAHYQYIERRRYLSSRVGR